MTSTSLNRTASHRTASHSISTRRTRTRNTILSTSLALVSWLLGMTASAHDSPEAHWCSAPDPTVDQPVVIEIGHFEFNGPQMRQFGQQLANVPGSCGQVDHIDQWKCAKQIAEEYCSTLSQSQSLNQLATPMLVGPTTAVADNHHASYQLAAGLYGACVICAEHADTPQN